MRYNPAESMRRMDENRKASFDGLLERLLREAEERVREDEWTPEEAADIVVLQAFEPRGPVDRMDGEELLDLGLFLWNKMIHWYAQYGGIQRRDPNHMFQWSVTNASVELDMESAEHPMIGLVREVNRHLMRALVSEMLKHNQ